MVNVLWEIAYGLHHESLCLDSLEDFNATEANLMSMKDDILVTWKSRDARKTSSLRPTFISSVDSRSQGSTLGRTFIPGGPMPPSGALCGPGGGGMSAVSSLFFRPLAPPPGIPSTSRLSPYIQELLPTSFPMVGPPTGYNFHPITGWPLKASTPDIFSLSSQPWDVLLPTSTSPHVTGLSNLPGLSQEECPLVVGPPSCSSRVVAGRRVPTVTVSSSTAETTLSSSPSTAPRISTSSSNMTGGDVCRVIWQHPPSSPNRMLAGAGVRRESASRPAKRNRPVFRTFSRLSSSVVLARLSLTRFRKPSGMLIWTRGLTAPFMMVWRVVLLVILASALMFAQTANRCSWACAACSKMSAMKAVSSAHLVLSGSCQMNSGPVGISSGGSNTLTPPLVRC